MFVGAGAAEHEVRVAIDQARRHPRAAERDRLSSRESRPVRSACRRGRSSRPAMPIAPLSTMPSGSPVAASSVAMLQSTSSRSHMARRLRRAAMLASKRWGLAEPVRPSRRASSDAPVGLVGVPLAAGLGDAWQCDLAPALLRQTLRRIGRYDVETRRELDYADNGSRRRRDRGAVDRGSHGAISEAVAA